jgi:hypothetical protein
LNRIINDNPEIVKTVKILDEQKNPYTITEFIEKLEQWKIKTS